MSVSLQSILKTTQERVAALEPRRAALERAAADAADAPRWLDAFDGAAVAVIAEVKRRSPSAGSIAPALDAARQAAAYVTGGAAAISVLTDEPHFGGSLDDLAQVRTAVTVPVLRKDFILDPVQLFESRAAGASAVLLIVRALNETRLTELARLAGDLGLARLVEVHDRAELDRAVAVEPEAIGVNSRDLETFTVDPAYVEAVLPAVPAGIVAVAESGITTPDDVARAAGWGADAVLVGTALARSADPAAAVRALAGTVRGTGARGVAAR